jgi:MFS family permease
VTARGSAKASGDGWFLVTGRFITMLGTGMAPICLAAAGLADRGIGAGGLGFIVGGLVTGELAFTLAGGLLADRVGARTAMICGDVLAFAAQGSVALLFATGHASTVAVTLLAFLLGTGAALSNPAESALIKQICRDDQLAVLNVRIRTAGVLARVLGAPAGGLIAAAGHPSAGLFADAATFLCSAVLLSLVAAERHLTRASLRLGAPLRDIRDGWRSFREIRWLLPAALAASVVNAARTTGQVLLPAALALAGYRPEVWGFIFGLQMAGNVVALWTIAKVEFRHALPVSLLGVALVGIYFLAVAARAPLPVIGLLALLAGGAISNFGIRCQTTMQLTIPDAVMSRVSAVTGMFSLVLAPVATGTLALLIDAAGRRGALAIWGVAALAAVLGTAGSTAIRRAGEAAEDDVPAQLSTQG